MRVLPERTDRVASVARYVLTHPWEVFVAHWNWKAAALSAVVRGAAFALPLLGPAAQATWRGLCLELGFRLAIGGFWGSLLQAFRRAQPAWLAAVAVAVALPAAAHALEFAVLCAGHAAHIKTGMIVSIAISMASLLINFALMRCGLLITGAGGGSLRADLRRIPAALAGICRGPARDA